MMSGAQPSARSSCSSESTSISIVVPRGVLARAAAIAAAIGSGRAGPAAACEPGQVIVLDQDGIVQTEAVVEPTTAPDRVLFQGTPAGSGLARVVDRRAGAGDRRDEPRRQGRDPAQPLEKVERGPLHRQQRTHRPGEPRDQAARLERISVGQMRLPACRRAQTRRPIARRPACRPARPADRATSRAAPRAWLGIVAVEVMSPDLAQVFRERLRDQHVNVAPLRLTESVSRNAP